jgi:dipeptidyl aminopeptidase/acylaminoacyl peptidase
VLAAAAWTIDAILAISTPANPRIHPDGSRIAYEWKGAIYTAPVSAPQKASKVAEGSRPQWVPGTSVLAYEANDGQVHLSSGLAVTASPAPVGAFAFDAGGASIYYLALPQRLSADPIVSTQQRPNQRLYRRSLKGGDAVAVSPPHWHVVSFAIPGDGMRAACAVQKSPLDRDAFHSDIHEITIATGATRPLVTQPGRDGEPSYSPDGRMIAFHSQGGTWNYFATRHIGLVPSGGGAVRYITDDRAFDVFRGGNTFIWSPDSRTIMFTAGRGTIDVLVRYDLTSGIASVVAERISGTASFSANQQIGVFLKTSPDKPSEIAVLESGRESIATHFHQQLADLPAIEARVVRWHASDGLEIEGVLRLPFDYRRGQRVPLLVELHGGPTGVALEAFPNPRIYPIQVFLQKGYAVLSPNFRGSSNYGGTFRMKNALMQGIGDFDDVMSGIDHLLKEGVADRDRLGVMGWSYGGYLTGMAITKTTRFRAASIGAPATDWTTYYGQTGGAKEVLWTYFGGTPWEVPENYARHSSRSGLRNIRTPALLQVGSEDIDHNAEIYQALTDHNVPVEYVVYPREGHGIRESAHQRDLLERNLRWFTNWLR